MNSLSPEDIFAAFPKEQRDRLQMLCDVFLEENAKLNLSALRTKEKCWTGNILDSLAALVLLLPPSPSSNGGGGAGGGGKILDIGTGGGFPLLPIAITCPTLSCVGLDAIRKKVDAVGRIAKALELKNVSLVYGRTEEVARLPEHRAHYDVVTARAVAEINILLEYAVPFAKTGGRIVLWKSLQVGDELRQSAHAQRELHCRLVEQIPYDLGGDWGERQLLVFEKTEKTPEKYPRAVGTPKKHPL